MNWIWMSKSNSGKGDSPRPQDKKRYDKNFDDIEWPSKKEKKRARKRRN